MFWNNEAPDCTAKAAEGHNKLLISRIVEKSRIKLTALGGSSVCRLGKQREAASCLNCWQDWELMAVPFGRKGSSAIPAEGGAVEWLGSITG